MAKLVIAAVFVGIALGKCDYFHRGIYARAEKYEASDEYREELEKQIAANPFLRGAITNGECFNEPTRGRKTEKGITEEFKKAYWAYESYLVSPDMACEMVGYSKNWFHKISLRYNKFGIRFHHTCTVLSPYMYINLILSVFCLFYAKFQRETYN